MSKKPKIQSTIDQIDIENFIIFFSGVAILIVIVTITVFLDISANKSFVIECWFVICHLFDRKYKHAKNKSAYAGTLSSANLHPAKTGKCNLSNSYITYAYMIQYINKGK